LQRTRDKLREKLAELLQDSFDNAPDEMTGLKPLSGHRHFSPVEQTSLTPEARGYLLSLVRSEQITRDQMELMIQYVSLYWDVPVGITDVSDLLDQVVFGFLPEDLDEGHSWYGHRKH